MPFECEVMVETSSKFPQKSDLSGQKPGCSEPLVEGVEGIDRDRQPLSGARATGSWPRGWRTSGLANIPAVFVADRAAVKGYSQVSGPLIHALHTRSEAMKSALPTGQCRPVQEFDRLVASPGTRSCPSPPASKSVGLVDEAELATYGKDGSRLEAIGTEYTPGLTATCGPLGQGLPLAAGLALALELANSDRHIFALMSYGEGEEGPRTGKPPCSAPSKTR